ncbi:MAG: VOC family protein [Chloroflexi bacterium]|nr:VOC family protein [Chloroflexota bacterium]
MRFSQFAISLNVADVAASAQFATEMLGFAEQMTADGFCSLAHSETGTNLIFLRVGLESFRPASVAGAADGMLLVFTVDDLDDQFDRLVANGASVVTRPETEPWGERYCQFSDPNGVIYQLVQWVETPDPQYANITP